MIKPRQLKTGPVEKLTRRFVVRLRRRLCAGQTLNLEEQHLLLDQIEGLLTDHKTLRQQVEDKHQALMATQHHLSALAPAPSKGAAFLDWAIRRAVRLAQMLDVRSEQNPSQETSIAIVSVGQAISALKREKRRGGETQKWR